jgi:hypothetical protein
MFRLPATTAVKVHMVGEVTAVLALSGCIKGLNDQSPLRIEISFQATDVNIRYEDSFRVSMDRLSVGARLRLILRIRLAKKMLKLASLYGFEQEGLPGHLVEQIVLQSDRTERRLDAAMSMLSEAEWRPILHPGHLAQVDMWLLLDRYGPRRRNDLRRGVRHLAQRYLDLRERNAPWTSEELADGLV